MRQWIGQSTNGQHGKSGGEFIFLIFIWAAQANLNKEKMTKWMCIDILGALKYLFCTICKGLVFLRPRFGEGPWIAPLEGRWMAEESPPTSNLCVGGLEIRKLAVTCLLVPEEGFFLWELWCNGRARYTTTHQTGSVPFALSRRHCHCISLGLLRSFDLFLSTLSRSSLVPPGAVSRIYLLLRLILRRRRWELWLTYGLVVVLVRVLYVQGTRSQTTLPSIYTSQTQQRHKPTTYEPLDIYACCTYYAD
jgi:hypothetical protein